MLNLTINSLGIFVSKIPGTYLKACLYRYECGTSLKNSLRHRKKEQKSLLCQTGQEKVEEDNEEDGKREGNPFRERLVEKTV